MRTWALPLLLRAWPVAGGGEGIWQTLKTGTLAAKCVREALQRRGAVDAAAIRSYRLACARAIAWLWDRSAMVQRALQWGYGTGRGVFSKVAEAR